MPFWKPQGPKSERAEINKARERDRNRCAIVPWCSAGPAEMAHLDARGMGGDHGVRTFTWNLIASCHEHHRGAWSLHSGHLRVQPLTKDGTDGAIEVYAREVLRDDAWYLLLRERACRRVEWAHGL